MVPRIGMWYRHVFSSGKKSPWGKIVHVRLDRTEPGSPFLSDGNVYDLTLRMPDGRQRQEVMFQYGYEKHQELRGGGSRIRTRKGRVGRDPEKGEIHKGDVVRITKDGRVYEGKVLSAEFWDKKSGWYIEFENQKTGRYGYWKQGSDGGHVVLVRHGSRDPGRKLARKRRAPGSRGRHAAARVKKARGRVGRDPRRHPEYGDDGWGVFVDGGLWEGFAIDDKPHAMHLVKRLREHRHQLGQGSLAPLSGKGHLLAENSVIKIRRISMPSLRAMMAGKTKRRHMRDPGWMGTPYEARGLATRRSRGGPGRGTKAVRKNLRHKQARRAQAYVKLRAAKALRRSARLQGALGRQHGRKKRGR